MQKVLRIRIVAMLLVLTFVLCACAGPQTVKPYAVIKATAEEVLYDARIMNNQGDITDAEFEKVAGIYDKVKAAQDAVINARITVINITKAYNDAMANADPATQNDIKTKLSAAQVALAANVAEVSALLLELQTFYTELKGGK